MGDKKNQKKKAAEQKKKEKEDQKKENKKSNGDKKKQDKENQKQDNQNKKDKKKGEKDQKRESAKQKKDQKALDKTMDFECEGEPKTWPWFQNKGHWECQIGNKGKVCAYVCNYNVSKQTVIFCDNGEWMDSRLAYEKCL